jgi:hypothetical protein
VEFPHEICVATRTDSTGRPENPQTGWPIVQGLWQWPAVRLTIRIMDEGGLEAADGRCWMPRAEIKTHVVAYRYLSQEGACQVRIRTK